MTTNIEDWQAQRGGDFAFDDIDPPIAEEIASERRPEIRPRVSRDNAFTKMRDRVKDSVKESRTAPRATRKTHPRVGIDRLIERGWEMAGRLLQPVSLPMGRMLTIQAPVAGLVLEDTIKGTVVDRLLQPLARAEAKGETVFALVGPPLLTGAIAANPDMAPFLLPLLKESLRLWLDVAGPRMEQVAKREAEWQATYGETIDTIITAVFAPPPEDPTVIDG